MSVCCKYSRIDNEGRPYILVDCQDREQCELQVPGWDFVSGRKGCEVLQGGSFGTEC